MSEYTPEQRAYYEKRYQGNHDLDLGDGHYGNWFSWSPDRDLNPQYDGIPDLNPAGLTIYHRRPNGDACIGAVSFASPEHDAIFKQTTWDVVSLDPLHIEPSVLCDCGDHGFIRGGTWAAC